VVTTFSRSALEISHVPNPILDLSIGVDHLASAVLLVVLVHTHVVDSVVTIHYSPKAVKLVVLELTHLNLLVTHVYADTVLIMGVCKLALIDAGGILVLGNLTSELVIDITMLS